MAKTGHAWKFFRAGGVDQVVLATAADLTHLGKLDQKLWVALACPVEGLEFDTRTLTLLDAEDRVIRPALIWCDQRTGPQCDWLHEKIGRERLIELTCNPALPNFTLTKLLWVKEHEPEIFARIAHVMCPKDYVRYRLTGSALEQIFTYYQHVKHLFPRRYRKLTRLRPPAVLKISLRNAYPRCYVTRRIAVDETGLPTAGAYYGPFPSRKSALAFSEQALDLFKVRRCQIKIRRDPTFPGCIYSEMKMCLAPCFAGCTKEEYDAELQRLVQFLDTNGNSLRAIIEADRERASTDLDFERAAQLHKRLEKLDDALRFRPELARRIADLDAVILQRAAEDQSIGVFGIHGGRLAEPFFLRFAEIASQPRSAEHIFKDYLEGSTAATPQNGEKPAVQNSENSAAVISTSPAESAQGEAEPRARSAAAAREELGEHLALISRWFYSNPRDGEIFFREKDWPYRKILRACSRLLNPKAAEPPATEPTPASGNPPPPGS